MNARDPLFWQQDCHFRFENIGHCDHQGLTSNLRDMIEICTFAMKYLRKEGKVRTFKPQSWSSLLETSQCQKRRGTKRFRRSRLSSRSQNKNWSWTANNSSTFSPKILLPSQAYWTQPMWKQKVWQNWKSTAKYSADASSECRSRLMNILSKETGRKSLFDCYTWCEFCWDKILKCGSNLMNYKSCEEDVVMHLISKLWESQDEKIFFRMLNKYTLKWLNMWACIEEKYETLKKYQARPG